MVPFTFSLVLIVDYRLWWEDRWRKVRSRLVWEEVSKQCHKTKDVRSTGELKQRVGGLLEELRK